MSDPDPGRKVFVLDTNVILHDSSCIYQFEEHDIAVPMAVLEELDQFKKGNGALNYHAREFVRALDALSGDLLFDGGVPIGAGSGRISVRLDRTYHPDPAHAFSSDKSDHRILNTAYTIAREKGVDQAVLVTKDVNLRMKAKAIGLHAEDYFSDHVQDVSALYRGHRLQEGVSGDLIHRLYESPFEVPSGEVAVEPPLTPHEFLILRNGRDSALATYDATLDILKRVDKVTAYGIAPRNAEQTFALHALLDLDIPLVTMTGKAGTGKTLLALAAALEWRKFYRQILVARPVVPLGNREKGERSRLAELASDLL